MAKRRPLSQNANEANPVACSNGKLHPCLQEQTQIPKSPLAQIELPATQLSDPNRADSSATTPMAESFNANTEVSGLKVSDILLPHPSLPNSLCLGPRSTESPAHLISCEANRIPFVNQDLDLSTWADCLRAWPNPPEDWVSWYNRMAKTHQSTWETSGIADALALSLSPPEKHEKLLKTIGYFWSDALNCFMFGHGPMTPTLLDMVMITGLDIASPSPSAFRLPKSHIPNFPRLATRTFPDATGKQIRCTSYGQALYSLPGSKLIPQEASKWFRVFFQGLDNPLFFPYTESEHFENPVLFRLDSFADDTSTRQLFSIMIRPCFLPVGMSNSNRIIKPGYESYQPAIVARQFGLGQVSPHFFLHFLTESRADLPDVLTGQRCYSFFDALVIPIPHNLSFTSSTDDFDAWWGMWKTHVFRMALGPLLKQLDAEYNIPAEQASCLPSLSENNSEESSRQEDLEASHLLSSSRNPEPRIPSPVERTPAQGYDLSNLLTFDPEFIEPTAEASEASGPNATHGQLQQLKALLSSSIETLVEDTEGIKNILEDLQPRLPVTLQVKLGPW
ncbi:hypothetical protein QYE76_022709 [Lolium multiflorum]|uniref:Aminotransferase-like plant mobile domain-containing protein n=1 Tax=Lolium multiflorum TaxID=4521 RepID=A0AAD8VRL6_LOLMU|nr:hypothetical protein QYE76_022709 [Lolium multiflorum]